MSDGTRLELDELVRLRSAARGLKLGVRRRVLSTQAGGYLSAYRGRGMEFDEVRAYQDSDDARTIDWRVSARRGQTYTKLFREEKERPVLIWIDLHPGMYFGSRIQYKSVLAGRLGALLGWAVVRAGDRVGGMVTAAAGSRQIHPAAREHGLLSLLHAMVRLQPMKPGNLVHGRMDSSLSRINRLARPGSLVAIFSDFREMGDETSRHLSTLAQHNDVIICFLYDPIEATAPPAGLYRLGDGKQQLTLDTSHTRIAEQWEDCFRTHRTFILDLCRRHAIHYMEATTSDHVSHALQAGLTRHRNVF